MARAEADFFLALQLPGLILPLFHTNAATFGSLPTAYGRSNSATLMLNNFQLPFSLLQFGISLYQILRWMADILALGWVGMWLGLSARKPNMAVAMTILFVMIVPAFVFCAPGLPVDLIFIFWARQKLTKQFRFVAMPQYDALFVSPRLAPTTMPPPIIPG